MKICSPESKRNKSATNPITRGGVNPDIFESDDLAKSCSVSYRVIKQYCSTTCLFGATVAPSTAHAFYCRGALGTRVNPDFIGCVWTGKFDLNTLRVDGEIFESGKKKLRIQKYPVMCGRGLNFVCFSIFCCVRLCVLCDPGVNMKTSFPFYPTVWHF